MFGNLKQRHYLISRLLIQTPHPTAIAHQNQFLNWELRIKKSIYKQAVEDRRGTFTPFVTSVDGLLHREAEHFLKRMATCVASKWKKSYAQTCGYIRARFLSAIITAASLCLRGSRVKWRSGLGFENGASLYSVMH